MKSLVSLVLIGWLAASTVVGKQLSGPRSSEVSIATQTPANDSYAGRTVIPQSALPFVDVIDTTQASTDADDAEANSLCGAPATDASVWFEFVATSGGQITVDVSQSTYSAGVIIATGQPGSFNTINCGPRTVSFNADAGQTYAILAFDDQSDSGGNGGELRIRITAAADASELLARIRALPHVVSATLVLSPIPDSFFFRILFEQPVDHNNPNSTTFLQRVTLLHRSETAPTVLNLDGYYLTPFVAQTELTYLLDGNQIEVEHRFFPPSSPFPASWRYLTIAQAAADDHRIVESFKNLYNGKWVSTGHSKGGMTAVYHRYFYPADVDFTVPYVAPSSHGTRDARYVQFVDQLGSAQCRDKLVTFQRTALARRAELLPLMPPYGFDILGDDRALEFAIVETPFVFWQYSRFNSCDAIPLANASADELFAFLDYVAGVYFYSDAGLNPYAPYYYQAATELGGPRYDEHSLHGLLNYPRDDVPENYPPLGVEKDFDRAVMEGVENWVQSSAQRMLFIYGATDPWSASAFTTQARNDSYRFFVTGNAGDHLAGIFDLSDSDFDFVSGKLTQWLNTPTANITAKRVRSRTSRKEFAQPTRQELFMR